jgi:fructoselysine-6-P-deglycase FrlB-like protein
MAMPTHETRSGRELLEQEMARQHTDALASLRANADMAARATASIMRTGRLLMIGMGASHYANRIAEPLYRQAGIEAWAATAADELTSPQPDGVRCTRLLVSQSGESGEIAELLARMTDKADAFGMTLDPHSVLSRALPSLIGAGGPEVAFAATRSLTVTLALHGALLAALRGGDRGTGMALESPVARSSDAALAALAPKPAITISGRGVCRGLAETSALMLMELARMPALGFELGQFRHGPLELLSVDLGVVLLRDADSDEASIRDVARATAEAGSSSVIFDCSGRDAVAGATTIAFPARGGLGAVLTMLPSLQRLFIGIAAARVEGVGEPLRSTKITRSAS